MAKAQSSFAEKEMAAYGKERGCTQRVLLNQSIYEFGILVCRAPMIFSLPCPYDF